MACIGSLWTFIEPIGVGAQLDAKHVQLVVSLTLIMQALGAASAAQVASRLEPRVTLICGGLIQCSIAIFLGHYLGSELTKFAIACCAFGFLWLFMMTFHVRLAFFIEPTGRLALFGPSLQLLGTALGPLVASMLVSTEHAGPAASASAAFAVSSVALLMTLRAEQS